MSETVAMSLVGVLITALLIYAPRAARKQLQERMQKRPARTAAEFGAKFFPADQAELAGELRNLLERYLGTDMSRLSPDDTFAELGMNRVNCFWSIGFAENVEKALGIHVPDEVVGARQTFRTMVAYVHERQAESRTV